jgi:hypothetical protein
MINTNAVCQRKDGDLLASPLGDEIVMMNVQTGDYLSLNKVATDIWQFLEQPISIQDICKKLLEKYNIEEMTCQEHTINFVQELEDKGLVEVQ